MSEERTQILNMLAEGKITVKEAEKLLDATEQANEPAGDQEPVEVITDRHGKELKYLRIVVEPKSGSSEKVNIKIPLNLIRAGIKLKSFIPGSAKQKVDEAMKEKGINFNIDDIKPDSLEGILSAMSDFAIDVDDNVEKVRIFCE